MDIVTSRNLQKDINGWDLINLEEDEPFQQPFPSGPDLSDNNITY